MNCTKFHFTSTLVVREIIVIIQIAMQYCTIQKSVTHLTMQAQYQLDVYIGHKQNYLASDISVEICFPSKFGTDKHAPTRVDNLIRADITSGRGR